MSLGESSLISGWVSPLSWRIAMSTAVRPTSSAGMATEVSGIDWFAGHVLRADRDHRDVLRHPHSALTQVGEQRGQDRLVVHDETGGAGLRAQHVVEAVASGLVGGGARAGDRVQVAFGRGGAETAQEPARIAGAALVDGGGGADQRDLGVPEIAQVADADRARRGEVQVDAAQSARVIRNTDQHDGPLQRQQHRHPWARPLRHPSR